MDDLQQFFDRMQDKVLAILELLNAEHKSGVNYGTGDRLSPVEAHTIQAVGDNQGLNLTALAKTMNVTKATMSERVKKLSRQGFVRKSKALDNRKEILITLAEKGRIVHKCHEDKHRQMFKLFADHYGAQTEEQLELFNRAFGDYLALARYIQRHAEPD
jgi:DNA-binding MarR family transcriptional regulator